MVIRKVEDLSRTALYRKYRSRALNEVIGQEHITEVLAPAIKNGVFSHAYLFTGPRGIGKTSVARILAYMVNNLKYGESSFDIIEIDAASHGLKEDIKDLIEKARIAPTREKYKVYIIDEVHSMKHDAFNTFLKLLEEPPEHVIFILATTDPQKLPATILSRAQRFHFRPVEAPKVVKHLKMIAKKENIDIDDEALEMITERGEGSLRDSISLLDQLGGFGKKITPKVVEELLGLVPAKQIEKIVSSINKQDMDGVNKVLTELKSEGISPNTIISQLNSELLKSAHYDLVDKLLDAPKSLDPWLKIVAILGSFIENNTSKVENTKTIYSKLETGSKKLEVIAEVEMPKSESKKTIPELKDEETIAKEPVSTPNEQKTTTPEKIELETEPDASPENSDSAIGKSAPIEINWANIVDEAMKINAPCGAWIAQASYDYDGEALTLYFRTKLQRTKMKEEKCWKTLRSTLVALYKTPPAIIVSDGPKPKSEKVSKVADIMGGGELL